MIKTPGFPDVVYILLGERRLAKQEAELMIGNPNAAMFREVFK